MKVKLVCNKCGKEPYEMDQEKSNENWSVYSTKCKCGGRIESKLVK